MAAEFDAYTSEQKKYDGGIDNPVKKIAGARNDFILRKVALAKPYAAALPPQSAWLDFGCGDGVFLASLSEYFPTLDFYGNDVSVNMLAAAKEANAQKPIHFFHLNGAEAWAPYGNFFDVVSTSCVFHHIPAAEHLNSLNAIYSALKPGGHFILFEHNPYNPATRYVVKRTPIDKNAVLISADEMRAVMTQAGFAVIATVFFMFFPPKFTALWQWERMLAKIPLGGQYMLVARKQS